ncbi:MAG: hypothetical protein ACTSY1_03820 [Alphaproteobacteria bacterium]
MNMDIQTQSNFYRTGEGVGAAPDKAGALHLRPASLARYLDLSNLRHDYPLVLTNDDGMAVQSLSAIIDTVLRETAPRGIDGECLRREVLGLEDAMRAMVSRGAGGLLSKLWTLAQDQVLASAEDQDRQTRRDRLAGARAALLCDGQVIDCNAQAPAQLLTHLWSSTERDKARRALTRIDALTAKLWQILEADFVKSAPARTPERLERSVGLAFEAEFDFEAMSAVLGSASPGASLPEGQRRRILHALSVLESQKFFAPVTKNTDPNKQGIYNFAFDSCANALKVFEERLPELAALVKAMSIAELEIDNQYSEATHDHFFESFGVSALTPNDLKPFPSYLVCLRNGHRNLTARSKLVEAISSGLPFKVLLQQDDILEDLPTAGGKFAFGVKSLQLPVMALGLNTTYVVQAAGSHLYALKDAFAGGMQYAGPALFSVFSGAVTKASRAVRNLPGLAPYLRAAAAMEARAFPAFTYDPSAGEDWTTRFRLATNPQLKADWPIHAIAFEDEDLQRITQDIAFTFVDFVASDKRYAGCFAPVPRCEWHDNMALVSDFLALDADKAAETVPYVLLVDDHNRLHRAIVADRLIEAARRCAAFWRGLQGLADLGKSPVPALQDEKKAANEEVNGRDIEALKGAQTPEIEAAVAADTLAEDIDEVPADEAYIETPRCTTCHECIEINNKMFSYDENMQAVIADLKAGSFRQLIEAAENCQVCIIHPGKPWNENEPDLDELVDRAQMFN